MADIFLQGALIFTVLMVNCKKLNQLTLMENDCVVDFLHQYSVVTFHGITSLPLIAVYTVDRETFTVKIISRW